MGNLFKSPTPSLPPRAKPKVEKKIPTRADASTEAVKKLRGSRNRVRQGRASTILTSGRGLIAGLT